MSHRQSYLTRNARVGAARWGVYCRVSSLDAYCNSWASLGRSCSGLGGNYRNGYGQGGGNTSQWSEYGARRNGRFVTHRYSRYCNLGRNYNRQSAFPLSQGLCSTTSAGSYWPG